MLNINNRTHRIENRGYFLNSVIGFSIAIYAMYFIHSIYMYLIWGYVTLSLSLLVTHHVVSFHKRFTTMKTISMFTRILLSLLHIIVLYTAPLYTLGDTIYLLWSGYGILMLHIVYMIIFNKFYR